MECQLLGKTWKCTLVERVTVVIDMYCVILYEMDVNLLAIERSCMQYHLDKKTVHRLSLAMRSLHSVTERLAVAETRQKKQILS